jgi:hypothetical protein
MGNTERLLVQLLGLAHAMVCSAMLDRDVDVAHSICNRDCVVDVARLLAAQRLLQQEHFDLKRRYSELVARLGQRSHALSLGSDHVVGLASPRSPPWVDSVDAHAPGDLLDEATTMSGGTSPQPMTRSGAFAIRRSRVLLRQFIGPLLPGQYRAPLPGAGAPPPSRFPPPPRSTLSV